MTLMDDSVRLPMAEKMKERGLAAILSQMPADDAKAMTEKMAEGISGAKTLADARTALNPPDTAAPTAGDPTKTTAAAPAKTASKRRAARKPSAEAASAAPAAPAAAPGKSG